MAVTAWRQWVITAAAVLTVAGGLLVAPSAAADTWGPSAPGPLVVTVTKMPQVTRDMTPTIEFTVTRPGGQAVAATTYCSGPVGVEPRECTSPFTLPIAWGRRASMLNIRAVDDAGNTATAQADWELDLWPPYNVSPRPRLMRPAITPTAKYTFRWNAQEATSYQTRVSITSQTAARMSRWRAVRRVTKPQRAIHIPKGKVACLKVRAFDRIGNATAWTKVSCVGRAFGERRLQRHGETKVVRGRKYTDHKTLRLGVGSHVVLRGVERRSRVFVVYRARPRHNNLKILLAGRKRHMEILDNLGDAPGRFEREVDRRPRRDGPLRLEAGVTGADVDGLAVFPRWAFFGLRSAEDPRDPRV